MGCTPSKDGSENSSQSYDRRPKISVRVQSEAKKLDSNPLIIFVFGGPGSRKGRVVDDLMTSYGFKFLSGEDIIFEEFPKSVGKTDQTDATKAVKEAINDNPGALTLDWLFGAMVKRMAAGKHDKYIVDVLPNLKHLMRVPGLARDCKAPLEAFEQKYPVCFALNLAVPADKVLAVKQVLCAEPGKQNKLAKDGQNDEADAGRIQKRASLFAETAKAWLDYFSRGERLVTVDVSGGVADNIWCRVHELLYNMDFIPERQVNTVILFAFEEEDAVGVDTEKYMMETLSLSAVASNPNGPMEGMLQDLSVHIDKYSREFDSFLVRCEGTSLSEAAGSSKKKAKKSIIFTQVGEGYIENYLPGSPKGYKPPAHARRYQAISSIENEICLFPTSATPTLCCHIASHMARQRAV